jgi:tryptophan-rich sensory protein
MKTYGQYQEYIKPSWAPSPYLFGPVWIVLYIGIAISFGKAIMLFLQKTIPFAVVAPFLLNILFNLLFTPIQFGLKNNYLAAIDIVLVLGTLIWAIVAIYPHSKGVAYAQIPYLLWVCFATVLQFTVTWLNR